MSLELKEITTFSYRHDSVQSFSVQTSVLGVFAVMTKHAVQILRPEFKSCPDLNLFNLKPFVIQCVLGMPTAQLETEEVDIYNSASHAERQTLLLDQRYFPKISSKHFETVIQSQKIAWNESGKLLAYLSNYGGLEIFRQIAGENEWESVLNVGEAYYDYLKRDIKFPIKTIKDMDSIVQDLIMTSVCFCPYGLLTVTKSNKLVLFKYDLEEKTVKVVSKSDILQDRVTVIEHFTTQKGTFLVMGGMDGTICFYKISQKEELELKTNFWKDADQIPVTSIHVSNVDNRWIILATKGGHVIFIQLNSNLSHNHEAHEMLSPIPITGVSKLSSTSFLLTLLTGEVKFVEVLPKDLSIKVRDVKLDFSLGGSTIYGISPSPNRSYFVIVSFVTQPNDHLVVRQPLNLTVCCLSSLDPLEQLLSSSEMKLTKLSDILEVVRYLSAKDHNLLQSYERSLDLTSEIGFSPKFNYHLKLSLILTGARYTYLRLRSNAEAEVASNRIARLSQLLQVFRSFDILSSLTKKSKPNSFEKNSGRCLRLTLLEYIKSKPVTDEFQKIYDVLMPEMMILVQNSAKFGSRDIELCQVCDKSLDCESLVCEEGHISARCSITRVQLPMLMSRVCTQCGKCAWNDLDDLRMVVGEKDDLLLCPTCDISFEVT